MTGRFAIGRTMLLRGALVVGLVVLGLVWAKWWPYAEKLTGLTDTRQWDGTPILDTAGDAGLGPSLRGGWESTLSYGAAVWKAVVVALVVAAAVETLVPRRLLTRLLVAPRRRVPGAVLGGLCRFRA